MALCTIEIYQLIWLIGAVSDASHEVPGSIESTRLRRATSSFAGDCERGPRWDCSTGRSNGIQMAMCPYNGCKWVIMVHKSQTTYQGWVAGCCSSHWFYSSRHCARTCAVQHGPLQHLGFVVAHFWHGSPGALAVGSSLVVEAISGMEWDLKFSTRIHCYAIGTTSCNLVFTEVEMMQKGGFFLDIFLQSGLKE